ncbi:MAG: ATP-dependent helicase [Halobacteriota archaeon]
MTGPDTPDGPVDPPRQLKGNQPAVVESTADRLVVDAGAGTGKTTTMVARIDRLLSEQNVDPNRILVLTFATKAAHSAVDRLTGRLDDAKAYDIDAFTYHSFCYRTLREYAYAVGLSPNFELLTEDSRRAVVRDIHEELPFRHASPRRATAEDLGDFIGTFRRAGIDPSTIEAHLPDERTVRSFVGLVRTVRSVADEQLGPDSEGAIAFTSSGDHEEIVRRLERFEQVFSYQLDSIADKTAGDLGIRPYLEQLHTLVKTLIRELPGRGDDWSKVPSALFGSWSGAHGGSLKDTRQTPIGRVDSLLDLFERTYTFLEGYRRYEAILADRDGLDYHGLIRRTTTLLDSDLGSDVASAYDYVFCDEFQDTDAAQLALIDRLTADASLFVIGDADQAIYEWRGAEPTNITDVESAFPGIEPIGLELNFRSCAPILQLSNELDGSTKTLASNRGDASEAVLTVAGDTDREVQAQQVSTTISNLLTGGFDRIDAHDLSEVAVLVRRNADADLVCEALAADSIPYERAGGTDTTHPPGIETLLSYLRVIVDPTDDRRLVRVLKLVYRLTDSDVRKLASENDTVFDGLKDGDTSQLSNPRGAERALEDVEALADARRYTSVSTLYERLCDRTRLRWTFTERDRTVLPALESRIDAFEDAPIDSRLTSGFVEYLDDPLALSNRGVETVGGDQSADAVDVMTVHQAKGLDFPVVLLPFLGPSWSPSPALGLWGDRTEWSVLERLIDGDLEAPLFESLSDRRAAEQWRILHVALTRARDRLVLIGNSTDTSTVPAADLDELLPPAFEWRHGGVDVDPWTAVTDAIESLSETDSGSGFADLTDAVEAARSSTPEQITWYDGTTVSAERATAAVRELTRALKAGTLDAADRSRSPYRATPRADRADDRLPRRHSHTSLQSFVECPRKHYLDHVVSGFDDPELRSESDEQTESVPWRSVGTLFHLVAEDAYWRGLETADAWTRSCERIARERSLVAGRAETKRCIDRYFQSRPSEWDLQAVEVPVSLPGFAESVDADGIAGRIDAVYRDSQGDLVVIDYKTTRSRTSIEESYQLLLYLLAADARFDEPIAGAGYLYVGPAGPNVQRFDRTVLLERVSDLKRELSAATDATYDRPVPGDHCRFCTHRSLGCATPDTDWTAGADEPDQDH